MRPVEGLLWARPCDKPSFIPTSRPRGAKAAGLRYERAFAKYLQPGVIHGQWFEFEDAGGIRYCQPDILYPLSKHLLAICEMKYTLVEQAFDQLLYLYGPVVECAYNIPVGLVQVFKNYGHSYLYEPDFSTLSEAAQFSRETGTVATFNWVGQPVVKPNRRTAGVLGIIARQSSTPARGPLPAERPVDGWPVRPPLLRVVH